MNHLSSFAARSNIVHAFSLLIVLQISIVNSFSFVTDTTRGVSSGSGCLKSSRNSNYRIIDNNHDNNNNDIHYQRKRSSVIGMSAVDEEIEKMVNDSTVNDDNDSDKVSDGKSSSNDIDLNLEMPASRWICPEHDDICSESGITLTRYMMEMAQYNPELSEVASIFTSLQVACKTISTIVRHSALDGTTGLEGGGGSINVQGEEQKKLDIICNDVLKSAFKWSGKLATLASEEEDAPVDSKKQINNNSGTRMIKDALGNPSFSGEVLLESEGNYVAVFDPLDGSSNVDAGIPVGTIFGIFEKSEDDNCEIDYDMDMKENERKCLRDTLQAGNNLIAAGYCLYSSATSLVITFGNGVNGFTLDENIGEFILTHPEIRIPERGKIYSFNEGNRWDWDEPVRDYVTDIQQGKGETGEKYTARYVGSMVADVHRTLQYGGIFGYPADKKNPNGKLRLLYEAAPMSFLIEQAGGLSITGKNRIMDIPPTDVHQRVPCILGSRDDVLELRKYYQQSDDPELIARCEKRLEKN